MRRRVLGALALATFAATGWAAPAFAHAVLQSTDPPSGAVVPKSPGRIVLHFGEPVEVEFGAVRVFNGNQARVDTGPADHPNGDSRAVAVAVPPDLGAGAYVVTWRVISADSHPVHGAFTFQIGAGGAASAVASKAEAAKLLAASGGSRSVGIAYGAVRFAGFASFLLLVGGTTFVAGGWPAGRAERRVRRLLWGGWLGSVVTTAAAIALQGPYGGGLPLARMFSPSVLGSVVQTRFGAVYLARLIGLGLLAGPLLGVLLRATPRPRWWAPAAAATGAAILITPGLAGHSGAGSLVALALPFDLVHMAAAAVWLGGLAVLAVAVLPRRDEVAGVLARYSQWALGSFAAITVSGGFAAWRQVGSFSAVTTTPYGRLLLAKTIIFAVLIGAASMSRRLVHGTLAVPFGLSRSGRTATRATGPKPATPPATNGRPAGEPVGQPVLAVGAPALAPPSITAPATAPVTAQRASAGVAAKFRLGTGRRTLPSPGRSAGRPVRRTLPSPGRSAGRPVRRTLPSPGRSVGRPVRRPPIARLGPAARQSRLRKTVLAELALAALIVAVTALLVTAQPARQAVAGPFAAEIRAGDKVLVDVVVDPAKAGPLAVHLYTLGVDGGQIDVAEVIATLSLPSAGIADLKVPLQRAGTGHFVAYQFDLPVRGAWKLQLTVRTGEVEEVYADPVTVHIR